MTIRTKALGGLSILLALAFGATILLLDVRRQDAALVAEASRVAAIGPIDASQAAASAAIEQRIREHRNAAEQGILVFAVTGMVAIALLLILVKRSVLDPLDQLTEAAASLTYGRGTGIQPLQRSDEIGVLTNALARMTTTIQDRESELQRAHRDLVTTVETIPVAFLLVDTDGRVRHQNRAATELIGPSQSGDSLQRYRNEFTLKRRDGSVVPADQWPLSRALRGEFVAGEDVDLIGASGRVVAMMVAAAPVMDETGHISGAAVAFQDVSALRQVDRLKDEFISVVSHELRTPVTSIRGSLQLVIADPRAVADDEHRELLNVALNNCERLVRIVNDVLDISKISAGELTLQAGLCDVDELIAVATVSVAAIARSAQVTIERRSGEPVGAVMADRNRIVQAVSNLLSNAVKFSPPGSRVVVEAVRGTGEVAISIQDEGEGIAPSGFAMLFRKFQQLDGSAARKRGGTGLGLAITKALIEQHGGRIDVSSEIGKGARFTVVLPAAGALEQPTEAPVTRTSES